MRKELAAQTPERLGRKRVVELKLDGRRRSLPKRAISDTEAAQDHDNRHSDFEFGYPHMPSPFVQFFS